MTIPWIQIYSNLPEHPKTYKLAEAIKQSNYATVGIMVCLWSWATINASNGDLSAYPNPRKIIEDTVGWTNKKINLYQALVDTKWIDVVDGKITIHDWDDYSAKGFEEKRKSKAAERQQKYRDRKKDVTNDIIDDDNGVTYDDVTRNVTHNVTEDITHNAMSQTRDDNGKRNVTPYSTLHNRTEHNSTLHNISHPNPIEGNDVTDVTGTEREGRREEICMELKKLTVSDNAGIAQKQTMTFLENLGYECTPEYPVPDRGDGRKGRIDILAQKNNYKIAIEFDWQTPRQKSIYKLSQVEDAEKIVLLRDSQYTGNIPGITVISIKTDNTDNNKNVNVSEKTGETFDSFEESKKHWRKVMDLKPDDDIPMQAFSALLKAVSNNIELELIERVIDASVKANMPSAWLAKVIENLTADKITTCDQYDKQHSGNKRSDGASGGGSFDTDEFFAAALERSYGKKK